MELKSTDKSVELAPNDYYCIICNVKNGSVTNYISHLNGSKHKKKLIHLENESKKINEKKINEEKTNEPKPAVSVFEISKEDNEENMKHCKICNKIFSGKENAVAHYKSKGHLHKLSIAEKTWQSECDRCNKRFSSELQWKQHLISKGHLKLIEQINEKDSKSIDEFKNVFEEDDKKEFEAKIAVKVLEDLHCHLCVKKFSGKKPVEDHLKCFEHKRHVRIEKENEERKRKNDEDWAMPHVMAMKAENRKRDLEMGEKEVEINNKKYCAASEEIIYDWSNLSRKEINVDGEKKKRGLENDDEQLSKKMKLKVEEESVNKREEEKVVKIEEEKNEEKENEMKENENERIKVNNLSCNDDDDSSHDDYDIDDDDNDDGDSDDDNDNVNDVSLGWCAWDDDNETLDLDDFNDNWNKTYLDDSSDE